MAIIPVGPTGRNLRMRVTGIDGQPAANSVGFIPKLEAAYVVGGKDDFKNVEPSPGAVQPANSTWRLYFGHMNVNRGFVRVSVNPALLDSAIVSYQGFWEERSSGSLFIVVRAFRNTTYPDDWVVKLYLED